MTHLAGILALALSYGGAAQDAQDIEVPAGKHGPFPGYIPAGATKEKPCPLIVACHGHGDTAKNFLACMKPIAAEAGVAVLAPEGTEKVGGDGYGWNDFPDRQKVIEGAIRTMLKSHPIDPKRIIWFGHSAGTWVCCNDGPSLPDLCYGIILSAGPTATLAAGGKGPRPRVCMFLGTADPNFRAWGDHVSALRNAKVAFTANRVTDLEHTVPDNAYVIGAIHWVLEGKGGEAEENTLPKEPLTPEDRGSRHLLVRFKGAEGADAAVKRSEKDAVKEAERLAALLRKEKAEKRAERAAKSSEAEGAAENKGELTREASKGLGPMVPWTCWTLRVGDVRVVKSPAGYHAIWVEK